MKFRTVIELGGKTATGFRVPDEVVAAMGSSKRPPVSVTVGAHTYRSTVAVFGGEFFVPLSAENRSSAGVAAGDEVEVDIELDSEPREVVVPAEFDEALDRDPDARRNFDRLSYSHKRQHVMAIEGAKSEDTRQRRIAKAIDMLRQA